MKAASLSQKLIRNEVARLGDSLRQLLHDKDIASDSNAASYTSLEDVQDAIDTFQVHIQRRKLV